MTLSPKKIPGLEVDSPSLRQVNLIEGKLINEVGGVQVFDLEQWPIMLFLKGIGFERVHFHEGSSRLLEVWAERIATYQTSYLFDPENFRAEECQWNEQDKNKTSFLIECVAPSRKERRKEPRFYSNVPPLEAPLGVDLEMVQKFVDEVEQQTPQETLHRIHSILKEYEKDSKNRDPKIWAALIADVIAVSLESKLIDKAVELAETHGVALSSIWSESPDRLIRLFSSYDPRGTELFSWSRIFSTYKNADLVRSFENYLSSPAGPQIVKFLNYRIQNQSDEIIDICFSESAAIQKLLHQWLAPHWREKHYPKIWALVQESLAHESLFRLWLLALLRSSTTLALRDLQSFFEKPKFWGRIFLTN